MQKEAFTNLSPNVICILSLEIKIFPKKNRCLLSQILHLPAIFTRKRIIQFTSVKIWPPEMTVSQYPGTESVNNLFHDFLQNIGREAVMKYNKNISLINIVWIFVFGLRSKLLDKFFISHQLSFHQFHSNCTPVYVKHI